MPLSVARFKQWGEDISRVPKSVEYDFVFAEQEWIENKSRAHSRSYWRDLKSVKIGLVFVALLLILLLWIES